MKQQILDILDKSTNNGMKAKEIVAIIQMGVVQAQRDMWERRKANRSVPSMDAIDWTVAMIEDKLFGRLNNGE
nr:MAG TPA: hypothetical protein [Caudoviricetes sp.]